MSNNVFVVVNQQGLYLSKQQEWIDGVDSQSLYRTRHRDEAINTVFEVSSRDIYLRAEAVGCELDAKGNPALATAASAATAAPAENPLADIDQIVEADPLTDAEESAPDLTEEPADCAQS